MCGWNESEPIGHTWVIDGYIQYESKGSLVSGGYLLHDVLLHCVWGYSGSNNGYYCWDLYNRFSGDPVEKESDDYTSNYKTFVFDENLIYLGGFIPNK
jgi:hypothetical protein